MRFANVNFFLSALTLGSAVDQSNSLKASWRKVRFKRIVPLQVLAKDLCSDFPKADSDLSDCAGCWREKCEERWRWLNSSPWSTEGIIIRTEFSHSWWEVAYFRSWLRLFTVRRLLQLCTEDPWVDSLESLYLKDLYQEGRLCVLCVAYECFWKLE